MSLTPGKQLDLLAGVAGIGGGGASIGGMGIGGGGIGGGLRAGGRDLMAAPEPEPGPLDDIEGESMEENAELTLEMAKAILVNKTQREGQQKAIELANETEYWFAVYFQTVEQKNAFLTGIKYTGEKVGDKYIDGQDLAKHLGVELPPRPAPYKVGRLDKKLAALT